MALDCEPMRPGLGNLQGSPDVNLGEAHADQKFSVRFLNELRHSSPQVAKGA
jgi:hypothetical protein